VSFLSGIDWARLAKAAQELWSEPGSNLGASLLFVAAVGILLLMLITVSIAVIYFLTLEDVEEEEGGEEAPARPVPSKATEQLAPSPRPSGWVTALIWGGCLVLALVAFDYVGGGTDVCRSCHAQKPHERAETDPHVSVACVKCHEDRRGLVAFSSASARGMHIIAAAVRPAWSGGYGAVTSRACRRCHEKQVVGVLVVKDQGVRISHAEPLASGATCTDCHVLNGSGELGVKTRGMTPCLRCHDGKRAKVECKECHLGDPSAAIRDRDRNMVFSAEVLVPDYRCGSCHGDQRKCDNCHGLRMPHPRDFIEGRHAKYAAFNKKLRCMKVCHTIYECNSCHEFHAGQTVSGHAPNWVRMHGLGRSMSSPCACHAPLNDPKRPFCPLCHD
jgi:hypothetical protein